MIKLFHKPELSDLVKKPITVTDFNSLEKGTIIETEGTFMFIKQIDGVRIVATPVNEGELTHLWKNIYYLDFDRGVGYYRAGDYPEKFKKMKRSLEKAYQSVLVVNSEQP